MTDAWTEDDVSEVAIEEKEDAATGQNCFVVTFQTRFLNPNPEP